MAVTEPVAPDLRAKARAAALKHGLDPAIFERQIERESRFDPNAVSPKGAVGIAQFMPETAREFGIDPRDPDTSLDAAARKMRGLVDRYKGDYRLALAGYNAGEGKVADAGGAVPNIPETRQYVNAIAGARPLAELGALIKRKYPAYANIPDDELGRRIKAKYPKAYSGFGQVPGTVTAPDSSRFETRLSPTEEASFQEWKQRYAPNDTGQDYDLRGAFKAGLTPDPKTGHWPDTFKKPNHPTFSDQSRYTAAAPERAGRWDGDTYVPPGAADTAVQRLPVMAAQAQEADRRRQIAAARAFPEALPPGFTGPPQEGQISAETAQERLAKFESLSPAVQAALRLGRGVSDVFPGTEAQGRARRALIPEPQNLGERLTEGLGGAAMFWLEAAILSPLGPAAAAGIPAILQPGTTEQRYVRGVTYGGAGLGAEAVAPLVAKLGGGATAQTVTRTAAGPAAFGVAAPWVEAASYHLLGHKDAPWPTAREMAENVGLLFGLSAATHGIAKVAERDALKLDPAKQPAFKAIQEHLKEPRLAPGTPKADATRLRTASKVATGELNRQLHGTRISFQREGATITGDFAYGRVFPYPGQPAQVRVVLQDPGSGEMVPFAFRDLAALSRAVAGEGAPKPKAPSRAPKPRQAAVAASERAPEPVSAKAEEVAGGQEPKGGGPEPQTGEPAAPARPEIPAGAPQGSRGYKPGEGLLVPYQGRSKTRITERARFEGYVDKEGEPHVVVRVMKGKGSETRTIPESMVRRRPQIDRRPATVRKPAVTKLLEEQGKGDPAIAGANYERARDAYAKAEAAAKQLDAGSDEYRKARRKLPALLDREEAALSVAYKAGWRPEPWDLSGGGISAFGVGPLHQAVAKAIRSIQANVQARAAEKAAEAAKLEAHRAALAGPIQRVLDTMKLAEPIRRLQEELRHGEKSERAKGIITIGKQVRGEKGFHAQLASLKGEHTRPEWKARAEMAQADVDALFNAINDHPELWPFETVAAKRGLKNLLGYGQVPTDSELALLERVFGEKFVDDVMKRRDLLVRLKQLGYEIANVPRAYLASFDISAPFRQGLFLMAAFPQHIPAAFGAMLKSFASEKGFHAGMQEIASRPTYELMRGPGGREPRLAITEVGRAIAQREEAFLGAVLAERRGPVGGALGAMAGGSTGFMLGGPVGAAIGAPVGAILGPRGVRASNRAYSGFLNQLRADSFDSMWRDYRRITELKHLPTIIPEGTSRAERLEVEREGLSYRDRRDPTARRKIVEFVNAASGRGGGRFLRDHIVGLNTIFFSPSFMSARIKLLNPAYYVTADPAVRAALWRGALTLGGVGATVVGLAAAGGLKVATDWHDSDWGKIVAGKTRFDIWGGFQQFVRFTVAMAAGPNDGSKWDTFERFVWGKTAPIVNFVIGAMKQQNLKGEPFRLLPSGQKEGEIMERFIPMALHDAWDAYRESPQVGFVAAPAAALGVGVQTFQPSGRPRRPKRRRGE